MGRASRYILTVFLLGCGSGEEAPNEAEQKLREMIALKEQQIRVDSIAVDSADGTGGEAVASAESIAPPSREVLTPVSGEEPAVYTPGGRYLLQVGAYKNRPSADRMAADLRDMGYPAQVVPGEGTFRVRIGFFRGVSEAEAVGRRLKQDLGVEYWIDNR